jgi:hypothetical protein
MHWEDDPKLPEAPCWYLDEDGEWVFVTTWEYEGKKKRDIIAGISRLKGKRYEVRLFLPYPSTNPFDRYITEGDIEEVKAVALARARIGP